MVLKTSNRWPSQDFALIVKVQRFCLRAVGVDFYTTNYRLTAATVTTICSVTIYCIFTATTVRDAFKENWKVALETCCMVGSVVQGTVKLILAIKRPTDLRRLYTLVTDFYAEYEKKGSEYCEVLFKGYKRLSRVLKLVAILYVNLIVGVVSPPLLMLFFSNKRLLMMHFLIPGLDLATDFGYYTTLASHALCMFVGIFGLYAGDFCIIMVFLQFSVFTDILKLKVDELNQLTDEQECEQQLKDIIKWHQFYTYYTEFCNDIFTTVVSIHVSASGISIVCTLIILLTGDWPGVYAYGILAVSGLYIYCVTGTQVEIYNDTFYNEICNIHWYKLSPKNQRMVAQMLVKAQHPAIIFVAGILPLSVSTALRISKVIYSIFMMLLEFLKEP